MPIAIAILKATEQIKTGIEPTVVLGELSLSGEVRPVPGVLPAVMDTAKAGLCRFVVPYDNAKEAALVRKTAIFGVKTLRQAAELLTGETPMQETFVNFNELFKEILSIRTTFRRFADRLSSSAR